MTCVCNHDVETENERRRQCIVTGKQRHLTELLRLKGRVPGLTADGWDARLARMHGRSGWSVVGCHLLHRCFPALPGCEPIQGVPTLQLSALTNDSHTRPQAYTVTIVTHSGHSPAFRSCGESIYIAEALSDLLLFKSLSDSPLTHTDRGPRVFANVYHFTDSSSHSQNSVVKRVNARVGVLLSFCMFL